MTAEIAILNKVAVALAADSAVTISTGVREEKIFDSADKLFELSRNNPIGVMIYNGMEFSEIPFQTIIDQFRRSCSSFTSVERAASDFLHYLNSTGVGAPERVRRNQIEQIVAPLIDRISSNRQRHVDNYIQNIPQNATAEDIKNALEGIVDVVLDAFLVAFSQLEDANFVGEGPLEFDESLHAQIRSMISESLPPLRPEATEKALSVVKLYLQKQILSDSLTGVVIAGFGSSEIFPTLISFEIDGMVCGRLKYIRTNAVDIDRDGKRAAVIPFAQKEMVERFLYGLDESIQSDIEQFCEMAAKKLSQSLIDQVDIENNEDKEDLKRRASDAEKAFIEGLSGKAFQGLRSRSQREIEDMVEFMPKPELAKMAEALVNLTSIKRKVSRGFETVGGPIDVAVISQSEGFIWVKRKHYFDPNLNVRYFQRAQSSRSRQQEGSNAPSDES